MQLKESIRYFLLDPPTIHMFLKSQCVSIGRTINGAVFANNSNQFDEGPIFGEFIGIVVCANDDDI
jgi:hypothetical protein